MASVWPKGGGATGVLMREHDWSRSPLGPVEAWPPELRSVMSLLLNSKFPMFVAWGPELALLYNDAYAEILGEKHPAALGQRFDAVWAEIWPDLRPLVEAALRGEASYCEDLPLVMNRYGFDEQTWFTFSYSPIEDQAGRAPGMFCAVVETTPRVREKQQRAFLADFDERLRDLDEADEILLTSAEVLGQHLGADRVHWAAVDAAADAFEVRHEWAQGGAPSLIGRHRLSGFGAPLVAQMSTGAAVAITDVAEDPLTKPDQVSESFGPVLRGALATPLLRGGVWQAALCVHTLAPRRWRHDERELIREAAERAWTRAERARAEAKVRDNEQRLRALVNASADIIFRVSADWSELRELEGRGLPPVQQMPRLEAMFAMLPEQERRRVEAKVQEAIAAGGLFELEHHVGPPDQRHWIRSWAVPLRDPRGEIVEWFGAASDVTAAHRARQALEETAERLQLATEAAEVGFWDLDLINNALIWPPRVKEMFGISPHVEISMDDFYAGLHPRDHDRIAAAFAAAVDPDKRSVYDVEYRTIGREDGRVRWVAAKGRGLFNEAGACVRVIGTAIDITVRKAAEEHLRLMVNELNHRVKNSLATVQAITAQTLRSSEVSDSLREALASRLVALAGAHDVLTDEKWSGAELTEIAAQAAAPYVSLSGASPFEIDGPSVFLPPKTAIALALAFHELATNAAKYGALSAVGGVVRIAWTVTRTAAGRTLRLSWRERGGPAVSAPQRSGFGTRLIQRGLASELQGTVSLDYPPSGFVCSIDALLPEEPADEWLADLRVS